MPYLVLLMAGCFAFFIVAYVSLYLLGLGVPVGAVWAFVIACSVLSGRSRWRPVLVTPDRVAAGTSGLPRLRGNKPHGRDWAWPAYLVVQWRFDWLAGWWAWRSVVSAGYRRIRWALLGVPYVPVRRLLLLAPRGGWTGVAIGMVLGAFVASLVWGLALVVAAAGWGLVLGAFRGYDSAVRRLRKAAITCPHQECYYEQRVPDYRCPTCHVVHRDIRPGLLGAVWRRCGCDTRLPTTVLRAARQLTAQCERCGRPLRTGSAAVTGISLPVFGPVSAGKTRLVHAGLVKLHDELTAAGAELDFDDESSRQVFDESTRLIADGGDTAKTPADRLPAAITAQVRNGRRRALVNLFDAAGEFFADRDENSGLEFLDHAGGLVFVVDPFSIPWVQDQLGGEQDARVRAAQPAADAPEDVYQLTAQRLRDYRVELNRRALAIVVVKADLLQHEPCAEALLSGAVREWLTTAGQDNLVLAAERDFAATRYFVASSVTGTGPGSTLSPAEPFLWLMHRGGFPVSRGKSNLEIEESA